MAIRWGLCSPSKLLECRSLGNPNRVRNFTFFLWKQVLAGQGALGAARRPSAPVRTWRCARCGACGPRSAACALSRHPARPARCGPGDCERVPSGRCAPALLCCRVGAGGHVGRAGLPRGKGAGPRSLPRVLGRGPPGSSEATSARFLLLGPRVAAPLLPPGAAWTAPQPLSCGLGAGARGRGD